MIKENSSPSISTKEWCWTGVLNPQLPDYQLDLHPTELTLKVKYPIFLHMLVALWFNNTSTLVGHFASSPREREKRKRKDCSIEESMRWGRMRGKGITGKGITVEKEKQTNKHVPPRLAPAPLLFKWMSQHC